MSILSILHIGVGAMGVQQQALQTTGHNLANVDTPGFSRQRVELATAFPTNKGRMFLGLGVNSIGVSSVVDRFLEAQLVSLKGTLGSTEAEHRALAEVADAFPITEEIGIGPALDAFFGALAEVANNPAGMAERVHLIGRARTLGDLLRQTRTALTTVQRNLDEDLDAAVRRVNVLLPQIAALNSQIVGGEVTGQRANDLRDQRQNLLQELSRLTGATVLEGQNGQVHVQVNGILLVRGNQAASLDVSALNASGFHLVAHRSPEGASFDATALLTKGEIGGLLAARDTIVPGFIDKLDQFAYSLVNTVNIQHAAGIALTGVGGGDFFTAIPPAAGPLPPHAGAAALVRVDSAVETDPRLIATAQDAAALPGDNRNALALAALQTTPLAALGNRSFKDYFLALVGDVGQQMQTNQDALDFHQSLLTQTQSRRESLSGVNIDEETANLIKFQRAFQAASRLIQIGDEMYQTMLGMIR